MAANAMNGLWPLLTHGEFRAGPAVETTTVGQTIAAVKTLNTRVAAIPGSRRRNIVPAGAVDGTNVTFTLPDVPNGQISLFNGRRLEPGTDYILADAVITMSVAPTTGVMIADYEV